ncbi:MAG TPA: hypothetical protein PL053_05460 [Deltaproteobacteria bacterium]|nr:hypothetical protein [Deltaproteobacteria bacterium]
MQHYTLLMVQTAKMPGRNLLRGVAGMLNAGRSETLPCYPVQDVSKQRLNWRTSTALINARCWLQFFYDQLKFVRQQHA